jgi:hypothetical protein
MPACDPTQIGIKEAKTREDIWNQAEGKGEALKLR